MPKTTQQQLDPLMVINAYAQGIFPMADHDGAIHWYAPSSYTTTSTSHAHCMPPYAEASTKYAWTQPLKPSCATYCAAKEETWINEAFIATYTHLHHAGLAHSVEAW